MWCGEFIKLTCALFWTLYHVNYAVPVAYYKGNETHTDKHCAAKLTRFKSLAPSLISCLTMCSMTENCDVPMYNTDHKRCYSLKDGNQNETCSTVLSGSTYYPNVPKRFICPDGWTFQYQSCYRVVDDRLERDESWNICKNFSTDAHLADINSQEENEQLKTWLMNDVFFDRFRRLWLGGKTDNGWMWSDGTPVAQWNWAEGEPDGYNGQRDMLIINDKFEWGDKSCNEVKRCVSRGLCELDIDS